jgi:hypothetical protein
MFGLFKSAVLGTKTASGGGLGVELVRNGTFNDASGWNFTQDTTIANGIVTFTGAGVGQVARSDPVEPITPGNYTFAFDLLTTDGAVGITVYVGDTPLTVPGSTVAGHFTGTITTAATGQSTNLRAVGCACTLDNFSVKRAP